MTKEVYYGVYYCEVRDLTTIDAALEGANWHTYAFFTGQYEGMSREAAVAYLRSGRSHVSNIPVDPTFPFVENPNWSFDRTARIIWDVRPISWREREQLRFLRGDYKRLPWVHLDWWITSPIPAEHLAHISTEDPTKVAFTASPEHGEADRQTRMKPGKYLQKYFGAVLTPKQIEYLSVWFKTGQKPPTEYAGTFGLATTPDDIEMVYADEDNVSSCMGGMEAVRVYGAGDLAVAHWDLDDAVVARALCWPDRKVFGRIYPEPYEGKGAKDWGGALEQEFRKMGWQHVSETTDGFNGAKLLKIPTEGTYMMPYLDLSYGVDDNGDHFVMTTRNADYWPDRTDGLLEEPSVPCDRCEDHVDEEELSSVATDTRLYGNTILAVHHEHWCESCRDHHSYYCEGTGTTMSDDVPSADHDGDTVTLAWAENEVRLGNAYQNRENPEEFSSEPWPGQDDDDDDAVEPCPSTLPLPLTEETTTDPSTSATLTRERGYILAA